MSRIVLDAGALIALERGDRPMWATLKKTALEGGEVIIPSAPLAQVWRGTSSQAALVLAMRHGVIASFDAIAREIGELCGRAKTSDVCDAQVAIVAAMRGDFVYTSDPNDIRRLLLAHGRRIPGIVRC